MKWKLRRLFRNDRGIRSDSTFKQRHANQAVRPRKFCRRYALAKDFFTTEASETAGCNILTFFADLMDLAGATTSGNLGCAKGAIAQLQKFCGSRHATGFKAYYAKALSAAATHPDSSTVETLLTRVPYF